MVFELVLGFLVLVTASYLGTTMALKGFFGREYFDPQAGDESDGPQGPEGPRDGESRRNDRLNGRTRTDDVPRASDVVNDESEDG